MAATTMLNFIGSCNCIRNDGYAVLNTSNWIKLSPYLTTGSWSMFSTRCNIYISHLCYNVSVRISVCDRSELAHYS